MKKTCLLVCLSALAACGGDESLGSVDRSVVPSTAGQMPDGLPKRLTVGLYAVHGDSWMAGVSVDLNVFDGGQTSGKIRQSRAELAQVKEMLRKATLGIGLEVEQARLAHEDAVERLAVTAQAVAQAEESAALSRARFEKGGLLTADLIGVESRLIETRMHRAVALADERIALADLRRALGLAPLAQPLPEM